MSNIQQNKSGSLNTSILRMYSFLLSDLGIITTPVTGRSQIKYRI